MAISDRIESIEEHLRDDYSVLEVAGADLTNVNKNILNLKTTWQERLLYFMNNGTDVVWNNWDKVTGEGTILTLNNTEEAPMKINLKGNTSQEGTPTPETPQDIHVVSGDNSIEVIGNLNTEGIRLGLYQISNGEYASPTSGNRYATFNDLIAVQPNTTYTVTTSNNINAQFYQLQYDTNKGYLSNSSSNQSVKSFTFTTGATTYYLAIDIRAYDLTNITTDYVGGIILYNDSVSASYPISLGDIELCKIGDYQDSIVKDNGKWYLNKQIGKVVLDGSENWNINSAWNYTNTNLFIFTNTDVHTTNPVVSNYFKWYQSAYTNDISGEVGLVWGNTLSFRISNTLASDTEAFKTWLSNNNTTVYYVLATPTYTEITDSTLLSQLNALAKSYTSQTNISQESNDLPFIINATALEEMS